MSAPRPFNLIAELTYRCPLRCIYCSNPVAYDDVREGLDAAMWCRVFREAAALGVLHVGLTGGEPGLRPDLGEIVRGASEAQLYSHLVTAGVTLDRSDLEALRDAGLRSVQLSIQDTNAAASDRIAGTPSFDRKLAFAEDVHACDLPLSLNTPLHRHNLDRVGEIIELASNLRAHRIELANTQYHGWALRNRTALLPSREQLERAAREVAEATGQPGALGAQHRRPGSLGRRGVRSIDAVVDVTNYVLLELGQPMHAFDFAKLSGGIVVREAAGGESLTLLDGQTVELTGDTLVIADQSGPLAMAGIMGGEPSSVTGNTQDILLEAAFFTPELMAGKARGYGLHTDSSHRYERGVDFELQRKAIERATSLLLDIVGGQPGPVVEAVEPNDLPERKPVTLTRKGIRRVLGFAMEDAQVTRILDALGLTTSPTDEGWVCSVPSWRFDVSIEADLLEELARIYGYDNLPVTRIKAGLAIPQRSESRLSVRRVRRHLAAAGYQEAVTYSFIDPKQQQVFDPDQQPVALKNPISADMAVMRTSLLPGLVSALVYNTKRQQPRVRLFETGLRFETAGGELVQTPTLALAITGSRGLESWADDRSVVDFFDLKGDVEALLAGAGAAGNLQFKAAERDGLHPGQTAAVLRDGEQIGVIGALHPGAAKSLGVSGDVFVAELDLAAVTKAFVPAFAELSRFPEVKRDLAVIVDRTVASDDLMQNVRSAAGTYLTDLTLFDVYEGKGIDPKRKSLALSLTFREQSRTLNDEEVNQSVQQVIDSLGKNYKAELRG